MTCNVPPQDSPLEGIPLTRTASRVTVCVIPGVVAIVVWLVN